MDGTSLVLLLVIAVIVIGGGLWYQRSSKERAVKALADSRADAQRWYERLGGQVLSLNVNDDPAVRQSLTDASERYTAAGSQLEQANTARQYELAKDTALEGLHYVQAARLGMGLDAGPDLPLTEAQRQSGVITAEREAEVDGRSLKAAPQYGEDTPYYYPGGRMQGRNVPAGYYSEPWWKGALATGAGVLGGMLLFDALFSPGFGGGYGEGDSGGDGGGEGDSGGDAGGGDTGGGDWGGDAGGGDWGGGGDFGGFE